MKAKDSQGTILLMYSDDNLHFVLCVLISFSKECQRMLSECRQFAKFGETVGLQNVLLRSKW